MNLKELRRREDFDQLLRQTLETGLADRFGFPLKVSIPARDGEQSWFLHPLFSTFFTSSASSRVRRFMADSFRFTRVRHRAPAQFLLGTLLASGVGLRLSPRAFSVSPSLPGASSCLILPGNRRIRLFDFESRRCTVLLKPGFSRDAIERELGIRRDATGPFPRITRVAADGSWFEEELLDGWTLARCPPWRSRRRAEREAFAKLDAWRRASRADVPAHEYARGLASGIARAVASFQARGLRGGEPDEGLLEVCVAVAAGLGQLTISMTHGDFQAGNVLLLRSGGIVILDWEYATTRYEHYDRFVYGLGIRFGGDWRPAFARYLAGDASDFTVPDGPVSASARRAVLAMVLLEDLHWRFTDAVTGPFDRVPPDLIHEVTQFHAVMPLIRGG